MCNLSMLYVLVLTCVCVLFVVVSKHCTVQVQNQLDEPPFALVQLLLAAHKFVATRTQHAAIVGWVASSRLPVGRAYSRSLALWPCLFLAYPWEILCGYSHACLEDMHEWVLRTSRRDLWPLGKGLHNWCTIFHGFYYLNSIQCWWFSRLACCTYLRTTTESIQPIAAAPLTLAAAAAAATNCNRFRN